jgi:hypothetical protein
VASKHDVDEKHTRLRTVPAAHNLERCNMITSDLSDGFFDEVRSVSGHLQCEPVDLLGVMMNESNVRATAHNPNGNASGLIQFMPQTLVNLGWNQGHAAFRQLTADQQMPFVDRYFTPYITKGLSPAARLYQATFLPATLGLGSDFETIICGQNGPHAFAYGPNIGFDRERKGFITIGDLQDAIDRACTGERWNEILARLDGTFVESGYDLSTTAGVQSALTNLGYDPGPVDGVSGPRTRAAVTAFQRDQGLAADGIVGPNTRAALHAALAGAGLI